MALPDLKMIKKLKNFINLLIGNSKILKKILSIILTLNKNILMMILCL